MIYTIIHRLVANALNAQFTKGDAIAIDMPMTVTAVIIYLAIVFSGLVVVSIADSFAPKEIATRLRVSKAKAIFTQVFIHLSPLPNIFSLLIPAADNCTISEFHTTWWSKVSFIHVRTLRLIIIMFA